MEDIQQTNTPAASPPEDAGTVTGEVDVPLSSVGAGDTTTVFAVTDELLSTGDDEVPPQPAAVVVTADVCWAGVTPGCCCCGCAGG